MVEEGEEEVEVERAGMQGEGRIRDGDGEVGGEVDLLSEEKRREGGR